MDVSVSQSTIPVVADLDGTLITGDLAWEGLFQMLRQRPWLLFMVPFWMLIGRARLKHEIAERVELDAQSLLYRKSVIELLTAARAEGRPIVLATGGGSVLRPENRKLLAGRGVVIYLHVNLKEQFLRISNDKNRPLLQTDDPRATLRGLYETRVPVYALAELRVKADPAYSVHDMAGKVIEALLTRPDVLERT